jgi:peptidoglycan/LPS O-acetylase OafA/YrhL
VVCFFFFFIGWVVAREEGIACRVLSAPPLRFIGRISYGMYLYHYAVFTGLKRLLHIPFTASGNAATQKMFPLELAVTIAVATMSFMWVEKPFMEWGARVASSLGKTRSEQRDATYQVAPATRRPRNRTGAEEEAV